MTSSKRRSAPPRAKGFLDALETSFLEALRTPEGTAEPVALLWTDAERQWVGLMARLQTAFPQVFTLGPYKPTERIGPAVWLRCVVDRALPEVYVPDGAVPILYLPGVPRQALRAGEECPRELQPLVELLYRGRAWHQRNGRDWTVDAFLVSEDGLGLDVAQDTRTREAALRSLVLLAETPLDGLRGHRLEADDFDRLAVNDPTRDLLRWIGRGDAFQASEGDARWRAFCGVCKSEFGFDPEAKGPEDAAMAIIAGGGKWDRAWERFREAPKLFDGVASRLHDVHGQFGLELDPERLPEINETAEKQLRDELSRIAVASHDKAIVGVQKLEADHGLRRSWVWAQLRESPLALALEPLSRLANAVQSTLGGATIQSAAAAYATDGWRCDRAAVEAMGAVKTSSDIALVHSVVRALYLPWLDVSARHFQMLVSSAEGAARELVTATSTDRDSCLIFVDGLRFDIAGVLRERIEAKGFRVTLAHRLAPMPTVTATAKPLATVVHEALEGSDDVVDFNPSFRGSGQPVTAQRLRDAMAARGLDILGEEMRPAKPGMVGAWLETGRLDELGHKLGVRLAANIDTELDMLLDQIVALFECGWTRLKLVTDHGWLLLPGGLPRVELPTHLAATKWARCATVKGHAAPSVPVYSWYWNHEVRIASPPGVASFSHNTEYAHGGISPQECVVPELVVERGGSAVSARIVDVSWRGMRCRVSVVTNSPNIRVDLRLNWKQEGSSIVGASKDVGPAGEVSLAVVDDSNEGNAATIVLLDANGGVLDRKPTTVGET